MLSLLKYLFAPLDSPLGENNDPQISIDFDYFGHAIRVARVINVSGEAAA